MTEDPLSRPNHYFHDSLGNPYTCTGDHNHPDLPQEVVDQARQAVCTRCKAVVVDEPSVAGTTMVSYYVPALGQRFRAILCGACGLAFREFLLPDLVDNELFQSLKAELQSRWV